MTPADRKEPSVLAVWFNTRGLAYALFDSIYEPVDWGKKMRPNSDGDARRQIVRLLDRYHPRVLVVQDCADKLMHPSERIRWLVGVSIEQAERCGVKVEIYGRTDIRRCFAGYGARSKDEIAREIAKRLPEFARYVPPLRKLWMSEDHRMALFDALALMFTHYARSELLR